MISRDNFCICGHTKKDHEETIHEDIWQPIGWCYDCFRFTNTPCKKFQLDNLRYVERVYEEVEKVRKGIKC